jgi:hypothetical protein
VPSLPKRTPPWTPNLTLLSTKVNWRNELPSVPNYFENLRVKTDIADSIRLTILNFVITDYEFNLKADMTQLTIKL